MAAAGHRRAQSMQERLTRARRLEALKEILRGFKVNAALRDQLGAGFITESVAYQCLHLFLGKGLLLRGCGSGKSQNKD